MTHNDLEAKITELRQVSNAARDTCIDNNTQLARLAGYLDEALDSWIADRERLKAELAATAEELRRANRDYGDVRDAFDAKRDELTAKTEECERLYRDLLETRSECFSKEADLQLPENQRILEIDRLTRENAELRAKNVLASRMCHWCGGALIEQGQYAKEPE